MTSKDLYSQFALLEANMKQNKYLLDAIRMMNDRQAEITDLHARALTADHNNPHETNNAVNTTRNKLREIIAQIRKLKHRQIFTEIDSVLGSLKEAESAFNSETSQKLNLVKKELENFSEAYEILVSNYQLGEIARLLSIAQRLDAALISSIEFASITLKNLCPDNRSAEDSQNALDIFLSSETDYLLFLEKALTIERIYEELCHLFDISSKQEPLKIIKIESGSLWLRLLGNPKAVSVVSSLIQKAAHFYYRNYTVEGKLTSIPKKVETVESVLHLADELKKRGIETAQLDDHLKKASVAIGNDLEKLLAGEEQVEVNGEIIALTPSGQQNLIAHKRVKMIQEKSSE